MINSFFKDEDEEIGKLLLLQEFQDNKTIEVSDLIKQKILSVLNVEDDLNDIPLEKLYLVDSLRNGNTIDISQLISMKLLNKILGDTPKKKGDEMLNDLPKSEGDTGKVHPRGSFPRYKRNRFKIALA